MIKKVLLGSHVSMTSTNKYLIGSLEEALSYGANTFMIYTGPPQNFRRTAIEKLNVVEFKQKLIEANIDIKNLVVHAPYIINLGNTIKEQTFNFSVEALISEIQRVGQIGIRKLVLHPGASVGGEISKSLDSLVKGLNLALEQTKGIDVIIALETMSGKGSEICINFDQMKYVIDKVNDQSRVGVCFDTCHLNDAGYDIKNNFETILDEFNEKIGLDKLQVVHLNDSKNGIGSHKDRHENIGKGLIGLDALAKILHHDKLNNIPFILETPWIENKTKAPYKEEINLLLKNNKL
ncbi:deoxyribonuclease IV [Spiroplasma endosymbiont of Crioceris asparagi]|uniref:deoxyribonuclease IV n=1 Tax=Spiroplasma endosymbiont of Crioceris asparagi TaxID=3066286 RepID=UPI0030CC7611